MRNIDNFINAQQEFIERWAKSPQKTWSNSPFYQLNSIKKRISPYIEYLPEPYLGNPKNSTAVFLNYNPGPPIPIAQDRLTGTFIKKLNAVENYHYYAENTSYFTEESGFWAEKKKFLGRLFKIPFNEIKIFALEICPWHSDKFKLSFSDLSKIKTHVEENTLKIAEIVAKNSKYQTIFSVGKDYYNLFALLGFKLIDDINKESNIKNWPCKKDDVKINRNFSIWESKTGGIYFNTWAPGGNKVSSNAFDEIILNLMKRTTDS
tara:strand:+ start:678 stop:1466 length:789 start_codon:yes stop_codon:yes gene_type:complete